ncbi:AMP-binding protein [uncultured Olleya sp.]|uniref:AMP-binding protein n=1 Tax=uncultured Olleya sp. TaxID=757243 RepID=UPI00259AA074|nr:AMP-binding protein [uncultured Olleya sp.]
MTPTFNKIHNRFKLNGNYFSFDSLKEVAYSYIKEGETFEQEIGVFLLDWLDDNEFLSVNTSGSTGQPKSITLSKQAMVNSAIATGDYFNLKPGNTALLCLPASYIAGKMMLVRALILGLEIDNVQPTTTPKINQNKHYDFCAMIPAQAEKSLDQLDAIKTLIIGGAQVSKALKQQFSGLKTQVFETYGMTETITHIAVKQINITTTNIFTTLPGITISQNKKECLVIDAPQLTANQIITNDVVKLHSNTTFEWLGRIDNVINSGGVKLFPEQIEAKLQSKIKGRFFITAQKDDTFGEVPVLVLEAKDNQVNPDTFTDLSNIQTPKVILAINAFAETSSGKVNRLKTMQLLKK